MFLEMLPGTNCSVLASTGFRHLLQSPLSFIVHVKADDVDNRLDLRLMQLLRRLDRIPAAGLNPVAYHIDDVLHMLPRLPAQIVLRLLDRRSQGSPTRRPELAQGLLEGRFVVSPQGINHFGALARK